MEINNLPVPVKPTVNKPTIVTMPHPLSAGVDRRFGYSEFLPDESLGSYLDRLVLFPTIPDNFVLSINDIRVSFDEVDDIYPKAGDLIVIRARTHGGGGGSDPLRTILTIAVIYFSGGTMIGGWAAVMGAGVYGPALVLIGGMLLVNALVPIKIPDLDEDKPSPTYSLSGSANRTRAFEPLPLVFGTLRMYPDHGAKSFTTYQGLDQYLVQFFNFGLSDITITDYKIGDTDLASFDIDVPNDVEVSDGFTGELDAYTTNVDTIVGGDLIASAGSFITKTTSIDTKRIALDFTAINFFYSPNHGFMESRLFIIIEYSIAGAETWLPFIKRPWRLDTNLWTFINDEQDTRRFTFSRVVPIGQYDVRIKLLDEAAVVNHGITGCFDGGSGYDPDSCYETIWYDERGIEGTGMTHVMSFDQLKSYQVDDVSYEHQKRLAITIRASGQLNGRLDVFNAIVSAKVLVWTDPTWTNQVSSNPAWQFLSLVKGKFDGTRRLYGAGIADSRIDLDKIKLWGAWCDAKGLECNIIFDRKMTVIDMLNTIARCGRAVTTWTNGKIGVIYDEANKPIVSVFGMSNIIRNSFTINYITKNQVDEVSVAFNNPDIGYKRDTISAVVHGVVNPVNRVTIEIQGITDKVQAGKEANLIAAEQFYRRRVITFESDMEGLAVQRGDVATLSHDVTQWGYSGRLISGTTTTLVLDRTVPFTPATQHYIGVRYPDGTYVIVDVVLDVGDQSTIDLATALPNSPDADVNNVPRDYIWVFDPKATPGKLIKITDLQPISEHRIRIIATDEEDDYYLSESDEPIYILPGDSLDDVPTISNLTLDESLIVIGSGYGSKVNVNWDVAGEYGGAFIQAKTEVTEDFVNVGQTLDKHFSFEWGTERTIVVRVVTYNLQFQSSDNSSAEETMLLLGKQRPPEDVINFAIETVETGFLLTWTPNIDVDLSEYEIRVGLWDDNNVLVNVKSISYLYSNPPVGSNTYTIKAIDTSNNYSENEDTVNHNVDAPGDISDFAIAISDGFITLTWSPDTAGSYAIKYYRIEEGTVWGEGALVTETLATDFVFEQGTTGAKNYLIKAIDIHDNESVNAVLQSLTVNEPDQPIVSISYEGINVIISYTVTPNSFPIDYYEIRRGSSWGDENVVAEIKSLTFPYVVDYLNETFWVAAYDIRGNISSIGSSESNINPPSVDNLTVEVIDNNVLLRWDESLGTLPIKAYRIYRGATFSENNFIQEINGTFAAFFENNAGDYLYWVVGCDTANNLGDVGVEKSVLAIVNQPPDYVLNINWESDFSGTKTNAVISSIGNLVAPVNTTETWTTHFTGNSWDHPQDQIDAGYPYYIEPSLATGSYVEDFDYEALLPATLIKVVMNSVDVDGAVVVTPNIKVKKLIGDGWTDLGNVWSAFATDFRYVRITLSFASTGGDDIIEISGLNIILDSKIINDMGMDEVTSALTGVVVDFNIDFIDVASITVTPEYNATKNLIAVYDFVDDPNPTDFTVYLIDTITGDKETGPFSWAARGY